MQKDGEPGKLKRHQRFGPVSNTDVAEAYRGLQNALVQASKLHEEMEKDGYVGSFEVDAGKQLKPLVKKLNLVLGKSLAKYLDMPLSERTGKKKTKGKSA